MTRGLGATGAAGLGVLGATALVINVCRCGGAGGSDESACARALRTTGRLLLAGGAELDGGAATNGCDDGGCVDAGTGTVRDAPRGRA
jgi:hypothetical protein